MHSKWEFQRSHQYLITSLEKIEEWANVEKLMSEEEINRQIAFVLYFLGLVAMAHNQLSDAEKYTRRGLEISETAFAVIQNLWILGNTLELRGHLKEAREMKDKEARLSKEMTDSSTEFPRYLGSLMGLARIQSWIGEYHQAIETVEKFLLLIKEFVEKAPEIFLPDEIGVQRMYGNILRKTGNHKKAKIVFQNCIEQVREYIQQTGPMNEYMNLRPLNDYGVLLHQIGDLMDAEECFREAIRFCKRSLKEFPLSLIRRRQLSTSLCNLGALLLETDRDSEADEKLKESLNLRLEIQSEAPEVFYYHSYIASSMNNLAVFNGISGKYEDAEELINKAIDMRLKHRTEETSEVFNPGLVAVFSNKGMLRVQSGDVSESKDAFSKSIVTARELHKRNPDTHHQALIKALSNMYVVASNSDAESDLAKETLAELRELGHKEIPDQMKWFVETSEMY
jgi:tetratricopeptide (TPR) repeat protein